MDTFGVLSVPTRLSVRDCLELWLHSSPRHAKMWTRDGVSEMESLLSWGYLPSACGGRKYSLVICFILNGCGQVSGILASASFVQDQFPGAVVPLCEQQPLYDFLALCLSGRLLSILFSGQCSRVRGEHRACNWLGSISNFCVTLSCSHSGLRQLERLAVVFCCSWRGKGDVIENLLLKRDFSKSKRTSSMFSKLMDVLQELWVMAETYFAVKSSGSQLGVLVE